VRRRCPPPVSPSISTSPPTALDRANTARNVRNLLKSRPKSGGGDGGEERSEFVLVEKLRIKVKAIFGRLLVERETHKRFRP